jgi:hypothetical protein
LRRRVRESSRECFSVCFVGGELQNCGDRFSVRENFGLGRVVSERAIPGCCSFTLTARLGASIITGGSIPRYNLPGLSRQKKKEKGKRKKAGVSRLMRLEMRSRCMLQMKLWN